MVEKRRVSEQGRVLAPAGRLAEHVGAGFCALRGGAWDNLAAVLAVVGAHVLLLDRTKMWNILCERCRTEKFVELRRTKCMRDGTTYIDP